MKTEINRKQFTNILKTAKTFNANAIRINDNRIIAQSASSIMNIGEIDGHTNGIDVTFDGYVFKDLQKAIGSKKTPFATIEKNDDGTATIDGMIRLKTINESLDVQFSGDVQTFRIATDALQKAIANVSTYVSNDEHAPILCGIHMHVHGFGTDVTFRATNRHYAGQYTIKGVDTDDYIASSCTMDANMMKAIATYKGDALYTIVEHSEKWTRFTIGYDTFTLQHMDGTYPQFDGIYSNARQANLSNIVLNRLQFIDVMTALTKLTDDKKSFVTKLHYTDGTATFTDKEGNFNTQIAAHTNGMDGDYDVAFNGKYMLNILKTLNADNVYIHVSKSNVNPMWITDALPNNETYEMLLLPYRIAN